MMVISRSFLFSILRAAMIAGTAQAATDQWHHGFTVQAHLPHEPVR